MILEMRDICKDYPMGKSVNHILKHIDLDVEAGEYLAIMGPSGSGKTTLLRDLVRQLSQGEGVPPQQYRRERRQPGR